MPQSSLTPSIKVEGLADVIRGLQDRGARAQDIRPVKEKVRTVFLRSEAKLFAEQNFKPLAESTKERKALQGYPSEVEVQTGALRASLTKRRAKGTVNKSRNKNTAYLFGSSLWYAKFQTGTKTQPKRTMIHLTEQDMRQIGAIIAAFIVRNVGRGEK